MSELEKQTEAPAGPDVKVRGYAVKTGEPKDFMQPADADLPKGYVDSPAKCDGYVEPGPEVDRAEL